MYENVQREKDSLVGKVASVEAEAKSLREELASSQESCGAAVKVSSAQVYSNVLRLTLPLCCDVIGEREAAISGKETED